MSAARVLEHPARPRPKTLSFADRIAHALGGYTIFPTDVRAREIAHLVSRDPALMTAVRGQIAQRFGREPNPLEVSPHDFAEAAHTVIVRWRRS